MKTPVFCVCCRWSGPAAGSGRLWSSASILPNPRANQCLSWWDSLLGVGIILHNTPIEPIAMVSVSSEVKHQAQSENDADSVCSSSEQSVSGAPSRLVPGHRMWATRNGRHVLGLIEDYNALRKQISEGRKLSRSMDAQLHECLHALRQQGSDNQVATAPSCWSFFRNDTMRPAVWFSVFRWEKTSIWRVYPAAATPCNRCWRRPAGCSSCCGGSLCRLPAQQRAAPAASRWEPAHTPWTLSLMKLLKTRTSSALLRIRMSCWRTRSSDWRTDYLSRRRCWAEPWSACGPPTSSKRGWRESSLTNVGRYKLFYKFHSKCPF